jgi:hypothetical protein
VCVEGGRGSVTKLLQCDDKWSAAAKIRRVLPKIKW